KHSAHNKTIGSAMNLRARILSRRAVREDISPLGVSPASKLAPYNRRGIGLLAEVLWVSLAQKFDNPIAEIIDRMDLDRLKTPVILFLRLINIIQQTQTN